MSLESWMSRIPNNTRLSELCMPGSHDAGLYTVTKKTAPMPTSYVQTQTSSIFQQLRDGVRFFDLRCYSRHDDLFIGHFAEIAGKGRGDLGGYGERLSNVLNDVRIFINNPDCRNEVVILRFSHIKAENTQRMVQEVTGVLRDNLLTNPSQTPLSRLMLRETRGRVIAIFEHAAFNALQNRATGILTFAKYPAERGVDLPMCGEYSNENDFKPMWTKQLVRLMDCRAHHANPGDHMRQLYWTLTGGNIAEHTRNESLEDTQLLRAVIETFRPNIVLHDFCNELRSKQILTYGNPTVQWPWPAL